MISKELLSEILGFKVYKILGENIGILRYCIYPNRGDEPSEYMFPINIYELAHKCKEWAKLKELTLFSGVVENSDNEFDLEWSYDCQIFSHKEGIELFYIKCESEPEAIFKACQWILDNKYLKEENEKTNRKSN